MGEHAKDIAAADVWTGATVHRHIFARRWKQVHIRTSVERCFPALWRACRALRDVARKRFLGSGWWRHPERG
jgi:hypothetical protein